MLETGLFHTDDCSIERSIRRVARRFVYELDDAVFLTFPDKIAALAQMADHVIVANRLLAEWAAGHNRRVSIIPTCVDADRYTVKSYSSVESLGAGDPPPVIGWIGSTATLPYLDHCAAALRRLAVSHRFELRVISASAQPLERIDLGGVAVRWVDIDAVDTVGQLHRLDIGIAPLPDDDPWVRYKGNAKMIQYMAVGLPVVGSAVGFNLELVDRGSNGLLAASSDEWVEALGGLLDSAELRRRLGAAARTTILERYTVQSRLGEYESILAEATGVTVHGANALLS